ncbi:hypothetical protein [Streptomyces sp. NPDC001787]|uniref:hypothetical protein n=1 Tax=Streptomyces sp. NPDC001787 TaxID=3154523 RepID=UPI003325AF0B
MPWEHNVPSEGQAKVAAGTSPTSWYTANDNVQHIVYLGDDIRLHESVFRFVRGGFRWEPGGLTDMPSRAAESCSPTSWYTPTQASGQAQNIAYVGEDRSIYRLFFRFGPGGLRWEFDMPSRGQTRATLTPTSPTSWYSPADNAQHIVYVGHDQQIHELYQLFSPGGFRWQHNVPNLGRPRASLYASPTSWYTPYDDVQHIAYIGDDAQIHELFFRFAPGGFHWEHNVISAGRPGVAGIGLTSWVTRSDRTQHVAYMGTDQQVHEVFFRSAPGGFRWEHNVPGAGLPSGVINAAPTSWVTGSDNVQHIAYAGIDEKIHEAFFRLAPGGGHWEHNVLSGDGPKARAGTSRPTSWVTRSDNVQHVAYVGVDERIHEAYFRLPGEDLSLDHFTFAGDISPTDRDTVIQRHIFAVSRVSGCTNLSDEERQRLRQTYNRPIHHTVNTDPHQNGSAYVDGSEVSVNFGVLFPQGNQEISQTLIHEMMHCAGYTHPVRRLPPAGRSCANPDPAVFDCPFDNGVYYGTPPLRSEFCIAGDQSLAISRLERKADRESCVIDEDGLATIHTDLTG